MTNDKNYDESIIAEGIQFKASRKKAFLTYLIYSCSLIVAEIVLSILVKLDVFLLSEQGEFTQNLVFWLLIIVICFQLVSTPIVSINKSKVLKMSDYDAGKYKLELDKKEAERLKSKFDQN